MSTRYQATVRPTTEEMLENVRQELGLDKSDKAGLLDTIARIASWSIEQASRGRKIVAADDQAEVPGDENFDPVLQRLRRDARAEESSAVRLSEAEAERLQALLTEPFEANEQFVTALKRALDSDRQAPDLEWGD